jgi:CheY-like chemotaxis protein
MYENGSHEPTVTGRGIRVLLVEDERSIAEPFARALRRAGYDTTVAQTGRDAISLAASVTPDVVLLDLALPDLDGRGRALGHDVDRRGQSGRSIAFAPIRAPGSNPVSAAAADALHT